MTTRASALTPLSLIAVGMAFVLVATLAAIESREISVAPVRGTEAPTFFEPKTGQMSLFAPPYCTGGLLCRILDRVIRLLRRLIRRFPFLEPILSRQIARIQALQARLADIVGPPLIRP